MARKPLTVRLDDGTLDALAAEAEEYGRKPAEHAAALIEEGLGAEVVDGSGYVERETRRDIESLVTAHPMGEALTAGALMLARQLDQGAGMATAAITKEWRAILAELAKYEEGSVEDDGAPDLGGPALGDDEDAEPA